MNRNEIRNLRVRKSDDLCKLVEMLGYAGGINQLQCRNGAFVSSLVAFLDDNPAAVSALVEWIEDYYATDEEEFDEDDEEVDYDEDDDLIEVDVE